MKNLFKSILFFALALTLFGCESEESSNVNQTRIFTSYELVYLQQENITKAVATFTLTNISGTRLKLSDGATIKFNGQSLPFNELLGSYELNLNNYVNTGNFEYKDLSNQTYNNTATIKEINFINNFPTTLARSENYTLSWLGDPVGSGDSNVNVIVSPNNLGQSKGFFQEQEGATSLILTASTLSTIDSQPARIILERKEVSNTTQGTEVGGKIFVKYIPTPKNVTLQ
jgi:hypothetical protein